MLWIGVGDQSLEVEGLVSDNVVELMLGLDWLTAHSVLWDFDKAQISLGSKTHPLIARRPAGWCRRVVLQERCVVPPRAECVVLAKVELGSSSEWMKCAGGSWITQPKGMDNGLLVARTVVPDRLEDVPVRVMNLSSKTVEIAAGDFIANLESAEILPEEFFPTGRRDVTGEQKESLIQGMMDGVHETVEAGHREKLHQLLVEYADVLSAGDNDLGHANGVKHSIDTGDARPVRQPLRRHPPAHLDAIQQHVSDMLRQGVIEPAQSPWASNIVLAKKKDGTLRCCIDYRQLNSATKKDAYPLPRIDMCLDAMSGATWFSTFDLRSSYHQVELNESDADKTAFICREGLFRFKMMPFGLCNAGATFQRLMDVVMGGLSFEICLAYIDDIIIYSNSADQHLERLATVLQRLREARLKVKPSKCRLFQVSVEFLGHVVSSAGIGTDPNKIAAISDWPVPSCVKEVRAFLGMCSYYRRFVKGFAEIAAPLHDLSGKGNGAVAWTDECQESFELMKRALTSPPVLAMPNEKDMFYLDTDASEFAIGAVLSQMQDGEEKVVAYASKKLSHQEMNYCVTRRELLAVVHFLKYFRHYVLGRQFVVRTDHAALQWLRRTPEPIGQQARWLEIMEEFNFQVIHRAGVKHSNADGLSRKQCRARSCGCHGEGLFECRALQASAGDTAELGSLIGIGWSLQEMAAAQRRDTETALMIDLMTRFADKPLRDEVAAESSVVKELWGQWPRLKIVDGVLCRRFEATDGLSSTWQIVIPRDYRSEFIRLAHEGSTGGHLGRKRTCEQVRRRGYWPGWMDDVGTFKRGCDKCAQYHRGKPPSWLKCGRSRWESPGS